MSQSTDSIQDLETPSGHNLRNRDASARSGFWIGAKGARGPPVRSLQPSHRQQVRQTPGRDPARRTHTDRAPSSTGAQDSRGVSGLSRTPIPRRYLPVRPPTRTQVDHHRRRRDHRDEHHPRRVYPRKPRSSCRREGPFLPPRPQHVLYRAFQRRPNPLEPPRHRGDLV